ncbi:hypothetical protein GCM10009839_45590 [Catenulispora yoronensis]|uniref:Uncharacterized protein n=1 Tax=Catenulispora yoronensis TaxID=450799 RepID=A0ABN2UM47_9ACTN
MKKTIVAAMLAGGALIAPLGIATSASAATVAPAGVVQPASTSGCTLAWHDSNTIGVKCNWGPFVAVAKCANGKTVIGASAHANTTSYAYCTSVNSHWNNSSANWYAAHA